MGRDVGVLRRCNAQGSEIRNASSYNGKLAFGIDPDKYLTWDLKQAAIYMGEFIIPKIRTTVERNQEKFKAIFLLSETFEHVPTKTCTLFNQNRPCMQDIFHKDTTNIHRGHFCTICWETLWILAPHRVVTCPMTTRDFWSTMNIIVE